MPKEMEDQNNAWYSSFCSPPKAYADSQMRNRKAKQTTGSLMKLAEQKMYLGFSK